MRALPLIAASFISVPAFATEPASLRVALFASRGSPHLHLAITCDGRLALSRDVSDAEVVTAWAPRGARACRARKTEAPFQR